jgi:hypothetical protein
VWPKQKKRVKNPIFFFMIKLLTVKILWYVALNSAQYYYFRTPTPTIPCNDAIACSAISLILHRIFEYL